MMRFETSGRRLATIVTLVTMATVGLTVGVPSGVAGFGLQLQGVSDREPGVADLMVDMSDSADPVQPGQSFHYNIRIRNLGSGDASGVRLVNTLPQSFEFISATGAKSCARDGALQCDLDDISHHGSLTVVLHVRAMTPGLFWDTATASSASDDPSSDNNSASESTEVLGSAPDQPRSHLTVVAQVVNDSGGTAGASDFALTVNGGSPNPAQFNGADGPGTDVTLDAGPYAVSQAAALGYRTTLSPDCQGTIEPGETKTCKVKNDDLGPITLALTADERSVAPGASTGYTATLTNPNGDSVAVTSINVTLAAGFLYRAGSTSGATTVDPQIDSAGGSGQVLTWKGPELPGNGNASFHFGVTAPSSPGDYYAGASASVAVPFTFKASGDSAPVTVVASTPSSGGSTPPAQGSGSSPDDPSTPSQTTTTVPAQVPPPEFRKNVDVEPVSGDVSVRLPGTTDFVLLELGMQVPFGSEVDATDGRVGVSTVNAEGTLFHADFYEGRFLISEQLANGITVLRLRGSDFGSCKAAKRSFASSDKKKPKKKAKKVKRSRKVVRHLWGNGKGKFRTTGRYVAATVHGTTWLTEDRCDGSRTFVSKGVVDVRDLVRHKTIKLRAGESYVARPR